jgi:hypothetical protein
MTNQVSIAKVNNVPIIIINNGEKRVSLKPICEALGVDFSGQLQKIKSDPILGSTVEMISTVGSDEKERDMQTIPFKYVFGWLFQIDSRKVKEESRETVLKYQMECYDVLYDYFTGYADYVEKRQGAIELHMDAVKNARKNYRDANSKMKDAEKEMDRIRAVTYESFKADQHQLSCFTVVEQEG